MVEKIVSIPVTIMKPGEAVLKEAIKRFIRKKLKVESS
jgi:predicted transcriptional regulator